MEIEPEAVKKQYGLLARSLKEQTNTKPSDIILPKVASCIDDIDSYHINSTKLYSGSKFRDYLLTVITNIISSYRVTHRNQDLNVLHKLIDKVQAIKLDTVYYVAKSNPTALTSLEPMTFKQLKHLLSKHA